MILKCQTNTIPMPPANRENASCSACGSGGFAVPGVLLLSFAHICYTTNMSGNQFFPDAQNFVIRGGTFMAADIVCDA